MGKLSVLTADSLAGLFPIHKHLLFPIFLSSQGNEESSPKLASCSQFRPDLFAMKSRPLASSEEPQYTTERKARRCFILSTSQGFVFFSSSRFAFRVKVPLLLFAQAALLEPGAKRNTPASGEALFLQ